MLVPLDICESSKSSLDAVDSQLKTKEQDKLKDVKINALINKKSFKPILVKTMFGLFLTNAKVKKTNRNKRTESLL